MARLTYGELRTNAEKIADELVKVRVLAGIEVLNEKYGPDWVDKVDPATLCLSSTNACVLGQVYHRAEVPEAKRGLPMASGDGYWRALLILNGEVEEYPEHYGFAVDDEEDGDYKTLTNAWLVALGEEA